MMTNREGLFLLIIGILLVSFIGYASYNYLQSEKLKSTQLGYQQGIYYTVSQITSTGSIPYFVNESGQMVIKSKPIRDICEGK